MAKKITDKVTWVGKVDWELVYFHGKEYSTERGSSYNSYLIRDKKTVLMDTVWAPYGREFVESLKEEIDLNEIDYIVMNHNESDHSGALPFLMEEIPERAKRLFAAITIRIGTSSPSIREIRLISATANSFSSKRLCFTGPIRCSRT